MSNTNVKIKYSSIIEKCNRLSAFEGKTAISGSGSSLFEQIRFTDREYGLIVDYANQGLNNIESEIGGLLKWQIEADVVCDDGNYIEIDTHSQLTRTGKNGSFARNIIEVLVAYVMYLWLADKVGERSAAYKQIYIDMLATLRKNAFRKKEPDWEED